MKKFAFKAFLATCASLPLAAPAFAQDNPLTGNIVLTPIGVAQRADIKLTTDTGAVRIIAAPQSSPIHEGATMQFFGSNNPNRPGQVYIDSGSHNQGAIFFRTAPGGQEITTRMRIEFERRRRNRRHRGSAPAAAGGAREHQDPRRARPHLPGRHDPDERCRGAERPEQLVRLERLRRAACRRTTRSSPTSATPVNAGDAVNKAYADANFIKFVPGAEQLSVGDANGTAPMINLRGGSTCCSGPGGHTPGLVQGLPERQLRRHRQSRHRRLARCRARATAPPGTRYKGAFRSGYADNEWDDANVGFFSWAGGSQLDRDRPLRARLRRHELGREHVVASSSAAATRSRARPASRPAPATASATPTASRSATTPSRAARSSTASAIPTPSTSAASPPSPSATT